EDAGVKCTMAGVLEDTTTVAISKTDSRTVPATTTVRSSVHWTAARNAATSPSGSSNVLNVHPFALGNGMANDSVTPTGWVTRAAYLRPVFGVSSNLPSPFL